MAHQNKRGPALATPGLGENDLAAGSITSSDNIAESAAQPSYGAARLTRQQRREIQRLSPKVNRELDSDRLFFAMNPDREHLVRPLFKHELKFVLVTATLPEGQPHVAVRQLLPGKRIRHFFSIPDDAPAAIDDLGEEVCRRVFESLRAEGGSLHAFHAWDTTDNIVHRIFPQGGGR